jgi:hypothetical protein
LCANAGAWWPAFLRTGMIALIIPYTLIGACVRRLEHARLAHPEARGGVLVDSFNAQMIDTEVRELRNLTLPNEPVLTFPALTMLNFIADRPVASRYYNHYAVHVSHDRGAGAAEAAERRRVEWAIADSDDFFSDVRGMRDYAPLLTDYVRQTFKPEFVVGDRRTFMRRREHPLGESTALDIRSACDLAPDAYATRNARHHVLHDSIYHMFGTGRLTGARMLKTTCALRVPPASTLTLMVGYRPPQMARAGSSITLSICRAG